MWYFLIILTCFFVDARVSPFYTPELTYTLDFEAFLWLTKLFVVSSCIGLQKTFRFLFWETTFSNLLDFKYCGLCVRLIIELILLYK